MNRLFIRSGAMLAAAAVVVLSSGPAMAATVVSQSTARALDLTIAGNTVTQGLGTVKATNDGTGETKTGPTDPPISVLQSQGLLNLGALIQQASATVASNGDGTSAACSGVAGNGGTGSLAEVGNSSCITPGSPVGISLANLDLTGLVTINPASALGPLAALNVPLELILSSITAPLSAALQDALGTVAIGGSLGAIEAHCTAVPGSASGTANLASTTGNNNDTPITLTAGGQTIVIASLPVNPAVNQHVVGDLSGVTAAVVAGVNQELHDVLAAQGATGPLAPLAALPTALQDQVIVALTDALEPLLQPIEDNVLDITLNKQVAGPGTIDVTAIDLQLLPAAAGALGFSALSADIANVTCGPNGRVGATQTPSPTPTNNPTAVPTSVPAGLDSVSNDGSGKGALLGAGALGGMLLLATGTAAVIYRRQMTL